ncbi:hypothetical protein GCM10022270_30830 [Terriglobus aquaticus]
MHANKDESNLTARGVYGNFVILEIAPGIFAHYAHLRTGSLPVRPGQRVHCGEVNVLDLVSLVGNITERLPQVRRSLSFFLVICGRRPSGTFSY